MDSFFASCEQQADPRLRGRPIAVSGDPKSRTVVAAASREAKKWGVKSGMTIRDARALCPHIQFVLGDPDKYVDVSRRVMAILRSYTEDVEIFSIDEAFVDVAGVVKWEKQAIALALNMKRRICGEVGEIVTCSIGIAPNKRLAKLASDYRKPDGLVVVFDTHAMRCHPEERSDEGSRTSMNEIIQRADSSQDDTRGSNHAQFVSSSALLSSLTLRDLCGIGSRIETRLHDLGIWTVSGLAAAPVELLVREFGVYGVELHDMANGRDANPVIADDGAPKSVGHAATLPHDICTLDEARPVIAELAEKVAARLRRYGFRGAGVHLTVRLRDFSGMSTQRTIHPSTDDGLVLAREAMGILRDAGIAHPIRLLGISVSTLTPRDPLQQPIFLNAQRWLAATQALDAVNDRYGDWTLQRATLMNPPPHLEGEPEGVRRKPVRYLRKAAAAFRATRHLRDTAGAHDE